MPADLQPRVGARGQVLYRDGAAGQHRDVAIQNRISVRLLQHSATGINGNVRVDFSLPQIKGSGIRNRIDARIGKRAAQTASRSELKRESGADRQVGVDVEGGVIRNENRACAG